MTYTINFLETIRRTPWATSFRFTRPDGLLFQAGQYIILDLGGQDLTHPLSLSDGPEEKQFLEITKRMSDSSFSKKLLTLVSGDEVNIKGPMGTFFPDSTDRPLIFLAGGIGITPIRSILKQLEGEEVERKIILLYGNENEEDIAFGRELERVLLADFRLVHVLQKAKESFSGYRGFINGDIISSEVESPEKAFFMISGPPAMLKAMQAQLQELQVPESSIKTDIFFGY